jgi:hypothetical protein
MGLESVQESCHPVGENVDSSTRVVHIGKDIACFAMASIFESFSVPCGPERRSAYVLLGCPWRHLLHRDTVSQDEDQSDDVHDHECSNDGILDVKVLFAPTSDSHQHPTDAELDRDDGRAIADFKNEEKLVDPLA